MTKENFAPLERDELAPLERDELAPLVAEALDRWEAAFERGEVLTAEEICGSHTEILPLVRVKILGLKLILQSQACGERQSPKNTLEPMSTEVDWSGMETVVAEQKFGRLRFLARGGLGMIYSATDQKLNRHVALKFIRSHLKNQPLLQQQLLVEAEITGRLEHPGIVPLYAIGSTPEGSPFYAMRLIEGETLQAVTERIHAAGKLSAIAFRGIEMHQLLHHFVAVCNTVAYAHNRGVLHRDLKPANVMIGRFGETIVVDWGLAIPIERDAEMRASGEKTLVLSPQTDGLGRSDSTVGTPAFMSPEQAQGERLTPASDVFSLGATLYFLLSGQSPHHETSVESLFAAIRIGKYKPLEEVNSQLPASLAAICRKALASHCAERYGSALELAQDIRCWLADEPTSALPDSWGRKTGRWFRHHRKAAQVLLIATMLLSFVCSVAAIGFKRLASREHQALVGSELARENSVQMAARFVARALAGEVDLRWRILETEAADFELRESLQTHDPRSPQPETFKEVQAWLDGRFIQHSRATRATGWAVYDRAGTQLARSPVADTIGKNYAYRDYFHGLGHDLPAGTRELKSESIQPIANVYRSSVFRSEATSKDVVVFSVPIWSGKLGALNRQVLGVLMMTISLGEFDILESGIDGDQIAILVDIRPDQRGARPQAGRILHHPHLVERAKNLDGHFDNVPNRETKSSPAAFRLDDETVKRCELMIQGRRKLIEENVISESAPELFSFRDPLALDLSQERDSRAAFEPVFVHGRDSQFANLGWIVIVKTQPR